MNYFSSKNRVSAIQQISNSSFDLLVIGGGITGAGIALDAASRGLKVALIDMQDFSAGTSSRSTKLIHGGLRYLKQLEFQLVAEVGKEREIVHRNAPHLTRPEHMLLPIVRGGSLNKFSARLAMWVYEWLAGVKKEERHQFLDVEKTFVAEPLLRKDNLLGSILFYEYRTDDARLTIEVMKEAVDKGAMAVNYMKAISFIYENGKITGAKTEDKLNGSLHEIRATYIVNATGPWVDELDDLDKNESEHKLHITKGVHIVVDWKKLPVKQSVYFDTEDKRMVFVIPREGKTYIGTTDTFYTGDIANPTITGEDKNYLLKCVNNFFTDNQLSNSDIESAWAGLRPLVNKPGKGPSEISRKDEIFESSSGLIIIAGGKLTGYRKMAQRVVDLIAKKIHFDEGKRIAECSTHKIQLSGGNISGYSTFHEFTRDKIMQGLACGLSATEAELLTYRYGSNTGHLYTIVEQLKAKEKNELPILLYAQLIYSIEREMCLTPSDFFIRRIGALYFDIETVKKWKVGVSQQMQNILGFSDESALKFDAELQKTIDNI